VELERSLQIPTAGPFVVRLKDQIFVAQIFGLAATTSQFAAPFCVLSLYKLDLFGIGILDLHIDKLQNTVSILFSTASKMALVSYQLPVQ
jgi:hypothetical protein